MSPPSRRGGEANNHIENQHVEERQGDDVGEEGGSHDPDPSFQKFTGHVTITYLHRNLQVEYHRQKPGQPSCASLHR